MRAGSRSPPGAYGVDTDSPALYVAGTLRNFRRGRASTPPSRLPTAGGFATSGHLPRPMIPHSVPSPDEDRATPPIPGPAVSRPTEREARGGTGAGGIVGPFVSPLGSAVPHVTEPSQGAPLEAGEAPGDDAPGGTADDLAWLSAIDWGDGEDGGTADEEDEDDAAGGAGDELPVLGAETVAGDGDAADPADDAEDDGPPWAAAGSWPEPADSGDGAGAGSEVVEITELLPDEPAEEGVVEITELLVGEDVAHGEDVVEIAELLASDVFDEDVVEITDLLAAEPVDEDAFGIEDLLAADSSEAGFGGSLEPVVAFDPDEDVLEITEPLAARVPIVDAAVAGDGVAFGEATLRRWDGLASKLERLAESLRSGERARVVSAARSADPVEALIAGIALGLAGSDGEAPEA
jgi:hypothetical protein